MADRYRTLRDGVHERFATVLPAAQVLLHEPTAGDTTPRLWSTLGSYSREGQGPIEHRYAIVSYLAVAWQDPAGAEAAIEALIDPLIDAVDADPKLGGRLAVSATRFGGMAWVSDAVTGFLRIGSILCRSAQITTTVTYKERRQL